MPDNFVKKCFDELAKTEYISYVPSSLSVDAIEDMQKKYNIVFPQIYMDFISAYAHDITELHGKLDNFLFEDDVDVVLQIPEQTKNQELQNIELLFESNRNLIDWGYLPVGIFDECYLLCLDLETGKVCLLDEEDYDACSSKADVEEQKLDVFHSLEEVLECFFLKKRIYVPDEM